jgi:diadenosine tetraphosphate (Ap4A) HIT family hydrolase
MATLFTQIINNEIPGKFVYKDEHVVAFMTIAPISTGHTLVVPRQEIDHWIDMPADIAERVMIASQIVGRGIQQAFDPIKVGVMVAGLEVPHVHYHLIPIHQISDLNFALQKSDTSPEELEDAAKKIRAALKELGYEEFTRDCE